MTRAGGGRNYDVRDEASGDVDEVRRVNELAFGRPDEAALVDALRGGPDTISLVAVSGATVIGHIFFTRVRVETSAGTLPAAGLGPMGVIPRRQRQGVGSALVRAGVEACRYRHEDMIVVLGHPGFYSRFGFVTASTRGLRLEQSVPDEAFMVLELRAGARDGRPGIVRYHPAFSSV